MPRLWLSIIFLNIVTTVDEIADSSVTAQMALQAAEIGVATQEATPEAA